VYKYFRAKALGVNLNSANLHASFFVEQDIYYSTKEGKDGVKRFRLSNETGPGYLPDKTDPDWSDEEIEAFGEVPKNISFYSDNEFVIIGRGWDSNTQRFYVVYEKKVGDTTYQHTVYFEGWTEIVPAEVGDAVYQDGSRDVPDAALNHYQNNNPATGGLTTTSPGTSPGTGGSTDPGTDPGTGSGTDPGGSVDPDDLARESTLRQVLGELRGGSIDDSGTEPWMDKPPPEVGDRNLDIQELANPDNDPVIEWTDFIPDVSPGDFVVCRPIEYRAFVSVGPARGLDATTQLDVCWVFLRIRVFLSWLFGVLSFIYIFRSFTRSGSES
jgi:hypothetical protein